jgi:hypothetical protein
LAPYEPMEDNLDWGGGMLISLSRVQYWCLEVVIAAPQLLPTYITTLRYSATIVSFIHSPKQHILSIKSTVYTSHTLQRLTAQQPVSKEH